MVYSNEKNFGKLRLGEICNFRDSEIENSVASNDFNIQSTKNKIIKQTASTILS